MTSHVPGLSISLDLLIREAKRRARERRLLLAGSAILIAGAAAGAMFALRSPNGPGPPTPLPQLLSQVQTRFGDGRLLSASVKGSMLTVHVAAPDEPSAVNATFEAQILAAAVHDSGTPIKSVRFLDARGTAIRGYGPAPVGTDTTLKPLPKLPPLPKGACNSAAQGVETSSLAIRSVVTLPDAGGACAFTFQTSDPSRFDASRDVAKLVNAIGDPNERPYLVELDDQAGVPQFVADYTPGGGGVAYVKPGVNIIFGP